MITAGIDIPIDEIITYGFKAKLWLEKEVTFRGRIYRNEKSEGLQDFIVPEWFDYSTGEYKPVETDDRVGGMAFVDVLPRAEILGNPQAEVRFCFAIDLKRLYPSEGVRATEQAHRDVFNILEPSAFKLTGLVRGAPAFSDYGNTKQTRMDMDPFYLFRYDTKIEYDIDNCYE